MKNLFISLMIVSGLGGGFYLYHTQPELQCYLQELWHHETGDESVALSTVDTTTFTKDKSPKKTQKKEPESYERKQLKPGKFYSIDEYARNTPKKYTKDLNTLATYLVSTGTNEAEKVRAIFTWVAHNIHYDDKGYNKGKYGDLSAEGVLKSKKAVCEGYSNLFKALCDEAGIEAEKVSGYSKGYGYREGKKFRKSNHAWNVVKIDGKWYPIDATWASGYGRRVNGQLVSTQEFDDFWFCTDPQAFIFTHLPEATRWQLTPSMVSLEQYNEWPRINKAVFRSGYLAGYIFDAAVSGNLQELPEAYTHDYPFKVKHAPYQGVLVAGQTYKFQLQSEYAEGMAISNNGKWTYFNQKEDLFGTGITPVEGTLRILIEFNDFEGHQVAISYKVVKPSGDNV